MTGKTTPFHISDLRLIQGDPAFACLRSRCLTQALHHIDKADAVVPAKAVVKFRPRPRKPSLAFASPVCDSLHRTADCLELEMADSSAKTPWHLWLVGTVAVLFNAIGVFDFVMNQVQGADYLVSAGMTPEQVAHYRQMPGWMMVVWAVGVFGAFLASVLLLLRRQPAFPVFVLSLAAFLVSLLYSYVLTNGGALMGLQGAVTSAVIAGLLVLFSVYARSMSLRGILR